MTDQARRGWRIARWSALGALMLLPVVAMRFSDEMAWDLFDFVFFDTLVVGGGLVYELVASRTVSTAYRAGLAIAVVGACMLVLINAAVGVIGSERDTANLLYGGVLAVGLVGALIARLRPQGMARALAATAVAHALVAVIALTAGWGASSARWPLDILLSTLFFAALWLMSAGLFRKAARERSAARA